MKKLLAVTLSTCVLASLVGCGTKQPEKVGDTTTPVKEATLVTSISSPLTLEFWHNMSGDQTPVLEGIVQTFNETVGKEKNITVNPIFQGSSKDLNSKVVGAIKAKQAPAVVLSMTNFVQDYMTAEVVVDLKPYIADATVGMKDWEDIFPAYRDESEAYAVPGIYSVPFAKYTEVLFYNKKFFEANNLTLPTTWEELTEVSRQATAITGKPSFGYDNLHNAFMTLVKQYGGDYTNSKGELLFAEGSAAEEALTMFQNNIQEGIWRTAGEDMFFSGPFANEMVQMYIGHTVESQYINMKNPDIEWGAVAIPQKDASNPYVISSGNVLTALNQTGNEEVAYAAYEFIKFLLSPESNLAITTNTGYMPIRQSVLDSETYQTFAASGTDASKSVGPTQADAFFFEPVFAADTYASSTVATEVRTMMDHVLVNGTAPQEALAQLVSTLK